MTGDPRRTRVLGAALGALAVLAGAVLTLRPYATLDALAVVVGAALLLAGLGEALRAFHEDGDRTGVLTGAALGATGALALVLPGQTVSTLAVLVGVGLVVAGALRLGSVARRRRAERAIAALAGGAGVVAGVLALAWPDATLLLLALVAGPAAVLLGLAQLAEALRGGQAGDREGGRAVWVRLGASIVAAVLVAALVGVSAFLHAGGTDAPDGFFTTPDPLPDRAGVLLRFEPFSRELPARAAGWRILYTTTDDAGGVVPASGIVAVPRGARGPHPVVLWDHGTTGVARACAPSLLRRPFTAGGMPVVGQVPERGWALVAPDYVGLGAEGRHAYLVGRPAARAGLDAVRAARSLPGARLDTRRTVVWGHSQGGGAALWTGVEARGYAPDVPLAGIAALAPASDVRALAAGLQRTPSGMLFATFVVEGYAAAYRDVRFDDLVRPAARDIVRRAVRRCLTDRATLVSVAAVISGEPIFAADLTSGALGRRLAENTPLRRSGAPTLVGQGLADELVLPAVQRAFARRLCNRGQDVDLRLFRGRDHLSVVAADSPLVEQLRRWTAQRFAGRPAARGCRRSVT